MKSSSKSGRPSSRPARSPADDRSLDILVAGGGYVGYSIAVAIAAQAPHLKIAVYDAAPRAALEGDERASAVAAAAVRMLKVLDAWPEIEPEAQPIHEMIVTDSRTQDAVRPVFLTFGGETRGDGEPFAHMVPNRVMVGALRRHADRLGVEQHFDCGVVSFERQPAGMDIELADSTRRTARLLIACDGVRSRIREQAGFRTMHWPYYQWGIVTTVEHERDHEGRAEEHFLPAGPFAILPLKGRRSSLVWTEREEDARRIMGLDDFQFALELEQRFGHKLGEIREAGPRKAFPLGLTLVREFVGERLALAGDAAHGIHPISGQGLNLGFKDAAALAETVIDADRLGLDIGSLAVLERYQAWRRFDTVRMGVTTDVLNRLFSNDSSILRAARDFGLGVVERLPGLKRYFIEQASGTGRDIPKLLKGEPV